MCVRALLAYQNGRHVWYSVIIATYGRKCEYTIGKSAHTSKPGMKKRTKQNANAFTTYD